MTSLPSLQRIRIASAAAVVALLGSSVLVGTAKANFVTANDRGWTECAAGIPCMGNDSQYYVNMGGIGPRMQAATWSTLGQFSSTDIDVHSSPSAHGTGTDIYYRWWPLSPGTVGE